MLLSLLLAAATPATQGAFDQILTTAEGETLVLRTIDWPIDGDASERVTVHWVLEDDGRMRYELDRQPDATRAAHQRACARNGMVAGDGTSWLGGEATTHGFSCTSVRTRPATQPR
ncbi:hypothetical protein [Stenotrophomonas sp.]|uniref:hypothetical protein n=1 Tax=Stenotrophomonas sp. TaxID=69392 RepID=UPI0028A0C293|nr:hypothetical protein [Stenotrophomonas sp.]